MFCNDTLDARARNKVFNIYVEPHLRELHKENPDKRFFLMEYDFAEDKYRFLEVNSLRDIKKRYYEKELGKKLFKSSLKQVGVDATSIYIAVFHYAPQGSWQPSLYRFSTDIWDTTDLIMGEAPTTSIPNIWFSDDILKKIFLSIVDINPDIKANTDKFNILFQDDIKKDTYMVSISYDAYMKRCKTALVPLDKIAIMNKCYKKYGNEFVVFNVINYLIDYFLFLRYDPTKKKFKVIRYKN